MCLDRQSWACAIACTQDASAAAHLSFERQVVHSHRDRQPRPALLPARPRSTSRPAIGEPRTCSFFEHGGCRVLSHEAKGRLFRHRRTGTNARRQRDAVGAHRRGCEPCSSEVWCEPQGQTLLECPVTACSRAGMRPHGPRGRAHAGSTVKRTEVRTCRRSVGCARDVARRAPLRLRLALEASGRDAWPSAGLRSSCFN